MKAALSWIIVMAVIAGGGAYGMVMYRKAEDQALYDAKLAKLKRDFLVQSKGLQLLDAEKYQREVGVALTRYFREIENLGKEFPEQFDVERKRAEIEAKVAAGTMDEIQRSQRDERIDFTLALFNTMRGGQYRPLYTAADKTFRFDIYDIKREKVAGQDRIKMSYIHWGAFGDVGYSLIEGDIKIEKDEAKPVEIPKITSEGQAPTLQIDGERWVQEFIPGIEVGYYDLPLFPDNATGVELKFNFDIRTVGGSSIPVALAFPEIPIPESWKVGGEGKWEAQERFATEEELRAAGAIE